MDPSQTAPLRHIYNRSEIDGPLTIEKINSLNEKALSNCSVNEKAYRYTEKLYAIPKNWSQVISDTNIGDIKDLNRVLLTHNQAIKSDLRDNSDRLAKLTSYCAKNHLFFPTAGAFPVFWENKLLDLLLHFENQSAYFGDEFDLNGTVLTLQEVKLNTPWLYDTSLKFQVQRIFTSDVRLFVVVDWDSYFSLICLNEIEDGSDYIESHFEGFWCDETTEHSWFL
ncbi:MAG: DUF2711 family protein [Cyanobacteria bacterium TGS_CYA1]|nr:DUF2711 family protein [Cyanobacteria bacterium TGS_CYA1]